MKRHNFHVDESQMVALARVAESERKSVSDLVREGIDRVIQDRLGGLSDRAQLVANLDAFLADHSGRGPIRTPEEIDALVTEVNGRDSRAVARS